MCLQWLRRFQPMFSLTSAFECVQRPFLGRLLGIMSRVDFVLQWGSNVDRQIASSNCIARQYISLQETCKKQEPPMLPNVSQRGIYHSCLECWVNGHFFWCPLFKGMLRCRWMVETLPPAITILQRFACRFNPLTIFNPLKGESLKLWHLPMTKAMTMESQWTSWTIDKNIQKQ